LGVFLCLPCPRKEGYYGIKDITLGPKLPAFVSPAMLDVLVKNFDLKPNTTVEADLARMVPAH
jgi:hydroxylamine reductase